jgi:hypothetical protein
MGGRCSTPHIQGGVVPKPPANFTRLDPGRSDVGMLIGAMLRACEVIATKSWSTSQEPTSEHWWADVLPDPRARIWRQARGFYGRDGRRTAQKSHYRLADEPRPLIEISCSKCEPSWKCVVFFLRPPIPTTSARRHLEKSRREKSCADPLAVTCALLTMGTTSK